ncbi:MAG: dihydroorotase [Candidatus Sumerlaeia bacterium]|nr:dihydroorotase [Candidatus Sumerlaeia bacterium]
MQRLLVLDALVVDPSQGLSGRYDVLVEDGRVAAIERKIKPTSDMETLPAKGLIMAPGFIDLHTHLREPGSETAETIESGTRAAARGGFTTIYCMPNTNPVCDSATGVQYVLSRAAAVGCVRVVPIAAITRGLEGKSLTNFGLLLDRGAGAFSDGALGIMNAEVMRRALEYTRMLNVPVFEHCEDLDLSGDGVMHEGPVSVRLGLKGIPRTSESIMVSRNVALAAMTGGHIHICHVSTRESVEAIREAKRNGVHVTAEVDPHHLILTDEAVIGYNTNAKVKPPLCGEEDRLALVQALEDGTIDCVTSSHAPHSNSAKDNVFDHAPFGVIGMESAFPVLYTEFVAKGRWSIDFLVEKLTASPARVMNKPWGHLQVGAQADFVLIETGTDHTFGREDLASRSSNCPFLGRTVSTRIAATFVAGNPVHVHPAIFPNGIAGSPQVATPAKVRKSAVKPKPAKKPARAAKSASKTSTGTKKGKRTSK